MKITIKNFRACKNKTLDLPDSGLVYLEGRSEAGKTTILESIVWALYGTNATRNVTPLDSSSRTTVELNFKDLLIQRTNKPNYLSVNSIQDVAAQGLIDKTIANCDHFLLGSYIQQKMKGCFLTLSPKEQLKFLNKLALDVDIDQILINLKEKEKFLNNQLETKENLKEYIKGEILENQVLLEQIPPLVEVSNPSTKQQEVHQQIKNCNEKISNNHKQQNMLISEKNHPSRTAENEVNEKKAILNEIKIELKQLEEKLKDIDPNLSNKKNELELKIEEIQQYNRQLKEFNNKKELLPIKYDQSLEPKVVAKINNYINGVEKLTNEIYKHKTDIENSQNILACPHCKTNLKLQNNNLTLTEEPVDIIEIKKQIREKQLKVSKANDAIKKLNYYLSFHNDWKNFNPAIIFEDVSTLKTELALINEQLSLKTVLNVEIEKKKNTIIKINNAIEQLDNLLKNDIRSISELDNLISSIEQDSVDINKQIAIYREELVKINNQIEQYEIYKKNMNTYRIYNDKLINLNEKLEKEQEEIKTIHKQKENCSKLKSIIIKSQLSALESIVTAINSSADYYLDQFFPDCGTSIKVLPQKINQDGSISDKIGIEIIHHGIKFKSLDDFSGGAENRAILAFQLAISDLTSSPILLLDEPLTGTHEELKDNIYNTIKNTVSNKLVIVIEHNTKENLFDEIINL